MPYHVRITSKDPLRRQNDALALDKDAGWIEENIIVPRRVGRDVFLDGQVFSWDSIDRILITQTDQPSRELIPLLQGRRRTDPSMSSQLPDRWYVVTEGRDVTDQFIMGAPGAKDPGPQGSATDFASDRRAVMVIYGHDTEAKTALFDWLRAIGLRPLEWSQLIHATGSSSPYIGQILERAFQDAQAVVALFTPDEWVLARAADPADADAWRPQARPNVLIEAGMALVTHPTRTVIAVLGHQELPSDLAGRHYISISHADSGPLNDLAGRLSDAGCLADLSGTDWLRAERFPDRTRLRKPGGRAAASLRSATCRPPGRPGVFPSVRRALQPFLDMGHQEPQIPTVIHMS